MGFLFSCCQINRVERNVTWRDATPNNCVTVVEIIWYFHTMFVIKAHWKLLHALILSTLWSSKKDLFFLLKVDHNLPTISHRVLRTKIDGQGYGHGRHSRLLFKPYPLNFSEKYDRKVLFMLINHLYSTLPSFRFSAFFSMTIFQNLIGVDQLMLKSLVF